MIGWLGSSIRCRAETEAPKRWIGDAGSNSLRLLYYRTFILPVLYIAALLCTLLLKAVPCVIHRCRFGSRFSEHVSLHWEIYYIQYYEGLAEKTHFFNHFLVLKFKLDSSFHYSASAIQPATRQAGDVKQLNLSSPSYLQLLDPGKSGGNRVVFSWKPSVRIGPPVKVKWYWQLGFPTPVT